MSPRSVALFLPGEPMCCPAGHPFAKDVWAIGEEPSGGQRCRYVPPPPSRHIRTRGLERVRSVPGERARMAVECGLLVYWMLMPGGTRLAAEVTSRELHAMEEQRMNVTRIRDFLGLRWMPGRAA